MKTVLRNIVCCGLVATASSVFAANGSETEGSGLILFLFLSFGALVIVFQLVPGVVLFYSMLKGIFSRAPKESSVTVDKP